MQAWVAGATGFTGKALVAELRSAGIAVVAHVRPDSRDLDRWRTHFTGLGAVVDTSAWTPDAQTHALRTHGVTHVFCCIGTTQKRMRAHGQAENSYEAVDYGLPKMLAEAAAGVGIVARFVYVSSLGASATASGAYLQWRWKTEDAIRASGVPFTIARPSFITGAREQSRPAELWASQISDGLLTVAGLFGAKTTAARYRSTDDVRLARALVRLAQDPIAVNQVVLSENLQ